MKVSADFWCPPSDDLPEPLLSPERRDIELVDLSKDQGTSRNSMKSLGKNEAKWFISSAQWRRRSRASCALLRLRPTVATTGASAR